MADDFRAKGEELAAKMPGGMLLDPEHRRALVDLFEILGLPSVVMRRRLRVLPEQTDGRRAEAGMLPWLLGQVGLDPSHPIAGVLDENGRRSMAHFAPALFRERGTRAALRRAASRAGPYPSGVFDWFALRTVVAGTPLPYILITPPDAGAYQTDIHVADPNGAVNRPLLEELIRMQLALSERANVYYVIAFDNGENGPAQWSAPMEIPADDEGPRLRLEGGASSWLRTLDPLTATDYVAWFAVASDAGTSAFSLRVFDDGAGVAYVLEIFPGAAGPDLADWTLTGAALLDAGTVPWVDALTYLVSLALYVDAAGTHITLAIDGNVLADVNDAAKHRIVGTVGVTVGAGDAVELDFVDVFAPTPDKTVVEHWSLIK